MTLSNAYTDFRHDWVRRTSRQFDAQEAAVLGVISVLVFCLLLGTDGFGTSSNISNVLYSAAPRAIIAIGMTLAMVSGNIDISVGSGVGLVVALTAKLSLEYAPPWYVMLAVALVAGAVLGAVNGGLVAYLHMNPIIATFATLNIFAFGKQRIFGENPQFLDVPTPFAWFGAQGKTIGIPNAWWIVMLLGLLVAIYSHTRPNGRHLYAIGNSMDAARVAGVRVQRRTFVVYVFLGLCVGLAACCLTGNNTILDLSYGVGFELDVIAAVVIGGTLLFGGRGTVLGTILGTLLVALLANAVVLFGLPGASGPLFTGIAIILAVSVGVVRDRRRSSQ